jgi:hypothetical protein
MIARILVFSMVLGFACTKKSGSSEEESKPQNAIADQGNESKAVSEPVVIPEVPGTPPDFLVGKWASDCINQPGSLQASIVIQYEFSADGNASSKNISYAAADCSKRFTKADVDGLTAQINADRALQLPPAAPMNAAELGAYEALWFPPISAFNFKLGRTLKDQTVEMNYTQKVGDQTLDTYVTIFVEDNNLYFAEVCRKDDLDNGSCGKIVGDSVKNRARDMSNAIPFRKI